MKVLIIGASGLVGSHCSKYFKERNLSVIGTHRNYLSNETYFFDSSLPGCFDFLDSIFFKPDVIIHCGALTDVDYCEQYEGESFDLTVRSTEMVFEYCRLNQIKLVYISTDYVFDGIAGPYLETSKVNPINVYGNHKLAAEDLVKRLKDSLIVRITNVYGEELRSKNFIAHLIGIIGSGEQKTLRLPFDQFATPIYAGDIAKMIYSLITENKDGVYNLASTDFYSRFQLAQKVKSFYKDSNNLKLEPISTKALNQIAKRPLNGGLLNMKFLSQFPAFEFTNIDKFINKNQSNEI